MIRIKVCGITNIEDALAAQALGADAIGLVFAKSPRRVEKERAREIVQALPPFVHLVGVFVDEEKGVIEGIADFCRLTVLQFHGSESPEYCAGFDRPVIKAFRISQREDIERMKPYQGKVSAFLLDTYHPVLAGGTGQTFDWTMAKEAGKIGPIILAGGLNPDNVEAAIRAVKPYAVDVSSGVEMSPGKKDHDRIRLFIERAQQA
ncbi:MAG: phosphoribosylanthranilate isomerase [Thermodesulfobacteriota bacterium]|nr:phosphoribosylanthranilate isomerase [Thermodesulfobacteriota bacterium]